ncbi:uncharacterized protein LOC122387225 isoform X2 [Amphibalanus amphitrite]|uniref:uncharacterized protein LOC122387225 isoform X2 n=1 Tax=Amphibalanus amphitrite TaxID=1232801 RepID=UPI001C91ED02|nr:uncharacterized protein LOC122387225 isoform X2 [Amphibalanus amphitrite]
MWGVVERDTDNCPHNTIDSLKSAIKQTGSCCRLVGAPPGADISSGMDLAGGRSGSMCAAPQYSHPIDTPHTDGAADELLLPQEYLTECLGALDAAVIALRARKQEGQALVAMELKSKLRALHAVSADLSGDGGDTLTRCRLSATTRITDRLAVYRRHPPSQSVDRRDRSLRPTAVPNIQLPSQKTAPTSPSRSAKGRFSRGIKRPKRYDDFQCVDDAPRGTSPVPDAGSSDMTELANKPPAALKSIIGILRTENAELRSRLEAEQGRLGRLVDDVERLVGDQAKQQWKGTKDCYRSVRAKPRSLPSGPTAVALTPLQEQQKPYLIFLDTVLNAKTTCTSLRGTHSELTRLDTDVSQIQDSEYFGATLDAEEGGGEEAACSPTSERSGTETSAAVTPTGVSSKVRPLRQVTPAKSKRFDVEIVNDMESTLDQLIAREEIANKSKHAGFFDELEQMLDRMGEHKACEFKARVYSEAVKVAVTE